jgi:hypothetical protein
MSVRLHPHAKERLSERGATEKKSSLPLKQAKRSRQSLDGQVLEEILPLMGCGKVRFMLPNKSKSMPLKKMMTGCHHVCHPILLKGDYDEINL